MGLYGLIWVGTGCYRLVQVGMGWHWMVWLVWVGTSWYRLVQVGVGGYGMVWVGMSWYGW